MDLRITAALEPYRAFTVDDQVVFENNIAAGGGKGLFDVIKNVAFDCYTGKRVVEVYAVNQPGVAGVWPS